LSRGDSRTSCGDSCRFLQRVNSIRPGTCPPETRATGLAAQCVKSCDTDADCDDDDDDDDRAGDAHDGAGTGRRGAATEPPSHLLKCCSNGCGWTCQRPTHVFDGQPASALSANHSLVNSSICK